MIAIQFPRQALPTSALIRPLLPRGLSCLVAKMVLMAPKKCHVRTLGERRSPVAVNVKRSAGTP